MSLGAIPVSEITNYYNEFDTIDDKELFLVTIQALDNVYLSFVNNKD